MESGKHDGYLRTPTHSQGQQKHLHDEVGWLRSEKKTCSSCLPNSNRVHQNRKSLRCQAYAQELTESEQGNSEVRGPYPLVHSKWHQERQIPGACAERQNESMKLLVKERCQTFNRSRKLTGVLSASGCIVRVTLCTGSFTLGLKSGAIFRAREGRVLALEGIRIPSPQFQLFLPHICHSSSTLSSPLHPQPRPRVVLLLTTRDFNPPNHAVVSAALARRYSVVVSEF